MPPIPRRNPQPAPKPRPVPKPRRATPSEPTGPTVTVLEGDCRRLLPLGTNSAYDLVFADPPFNIGEAYDYYEDRLEWEDYVKFTYEWLNRSVGSLRKGGTLCAHVPDAVVPIILGWKNTAGFGLQCRQVDWIIWHYRFGQAQSAAKATKCINSKAHLLVFVRQGGTRTFNPPMVASDRAAVYGDKRTNGSTTPGMRVALDVWGVPSDGPYWGRVQGNNEERWDIKHGALVDHPNQLPEVYVARAMQAFSNPGDRVLCPFGGSGTETVVAAALGRSITTIELSPQGADSIRKRVARGAIRVGKEATS